MNQISGFISLSQTIMQNAKPKIDVAVYKTGADYDCGFDQLLDAGYSYDIISSASLLFSNSKISKEGEINKSGPSYKAIIIKDQESIYMADVDKLLEYVIAGYPIIIYGKVPSKIPSVSAKDVKTISGTDAELVEKMNELLTYDNVVHVVQESIPMADVYKLLEYAIAGYPIIIYGKVPSEIPSVSAEDVKTISGTDAELVEKMDELLTYDNVVRVVRGDELVSTLSDLNVVPSVEYSQSRLRSVHRVDEDGDYYWLYNSGSTDINTEITLTGGGKPYRLGLWNNEITPIVQYTAASGRITTNLELKAGDATVIAITENAYLGDTEAHNVTSGYADAQ